MEHKSATKVATTQIGLIDSCRYAEQLVLHSIKNATVDNDEVIWLKARLGLRGDKAWKQKLMDKQQAEENKKTTANNKKRATTTRSNPRPKRLRKR